MNLVPLNNYFEIHNGLAKSNLTIYTLKRDDNFIPYIRPSKSYENSLDGYVDKRLIQKDQIFSSGTIYISTDGQGSHSYSYISSFEFVPNSNVITLTPKIELHLEEKLFYAQCITMNRFKFSYARKPKKNRLKDILIPSKDSIPDFVYNQKMEIISRDPLINKQISLNDRECDWFKLNDLFCMQKTTPEHKVNVQLGKIRYITRTAINNGVESYIQGKNINPANKITIGGESAISFYQNKEFITGNNITILYNDILNEFIAMFITTLINKDIYRYSYGRARTLLRLEQEKINLPITNTGTPDWQFMEDYIKALPYTKNLA